MTDSITSYDTAMIDEFIGKYVAENPSRNKEFVLDPRKISPSLVQLADILYPDPEYLAWLLEENKVYGGRSPLEVLSELDAFKLRQNTDKMLNGFASALSFASVDSFPTSDQVFYETRLAQYEQLRSKLE